MAAVVGASVAVTVTTIAPVGELVPPPPPPPPPPPIRPSIALEAVRSAVARGLVGVAAAADEVLVCGGMLDCDVSADGVCVCDLSPALDAAECNRD